MSVTDTDKGARDLLRRINGKRLRMRVGIYGEAAAAKANDAKRATVGQIAAAHEFGIGVPRRSWLGDTIRQNQQTIETGLRRAAADVITKKTTEERALRALGVFLVGASRARISAGISPALSDRYLLRKLKKYPGATTPLIASGQMWGSIAYEIEGMPAGGGGRGTKGKRASRASKRLARASKRLQKKLSKARRVGARKARNLLRAQSRRGRRLVRQLRRSSRALLRIVGIRTRRPRAISARSYDRGVQAREANE